MKHKSKNSFLASSAILAVLFGSTTIRSFAATVLTDNNFDGGASTGPAFQQVTNGLGDPTADPSTGVITTSGNGNSAVGLNNDEAVNVTTAAPGATGFRIQWVVTSANIADIGTNNSGAPRSNGWFFGVTNNTGTGSGGLFNSAGNSFGVTLLSGTYNTMALFEKGAGTQSSASLVDTPTEDSFNDGFTVELTFNDDQTWSLITTGLSENINSSGTATVASYSSLATNLVAYTSVQGSDISYTVGSVTLEAIPEPSTALLGGLSLLALLRRRR